MKILIQRVSGASVVVDGETVGAIDAGLLALVGIEPEDDETLMARMADKLLAYRVFSDQNGKMNCSLQEVGGGLLVISQFTLAASTRKGLRPSFSTAAPPAQARSRFEQFVKMLKERHHIVAEGVFGADMKVSLTNDGPVTFLLEMNNSL